MSSETHGPSDEKTIICDDAMDASSVQYFTELSEYVRIFGNTIDRIGRPENGGFFHVWRKKKPYSIFERSLPLEMAELPFYRYEVVKIPPHCRIKTGVVIPWFGFPGGAQQVQFVNPFGVVLTAAELVEAGVLR